MPGRGSGCGPVARAEAQGPPVGLEAADREDALADLLDEKGLEGWRLAPPLAEAGVDAEWVGRVEAHAGAALGAALWPSGDLGLWPHEATRGSFETVPTPVIVASGFASVGQAVGELEGEVHAKYAGIEDEDGTRVARIELALARGRDTRPADDAEHAKLHAKKK